MKGKHLERDLLRRVPEDDPPLPGAAGRIPPQRHRGRRDRRHPGRCCSARCSTTAVPDKNETLVLVARGPGRRRGPGQRAALSLVQRYYSARVGEGLIYDMRVTLFDHVQRLPISFFTRTQTGSLTSRMNNDVIGRATGRHDDARHGRVEHHHARRDARRHARARVAAHDPHPRRAAGLHHPGPAHRPPAAGRHPRGLPARRVDEQHDRRALQRLRRARREALRQPRPRARRLRRARRDASATSASRSAIYSSACSSSPSGSSPRSAPRSCTTSVGSLVISQRDLDRDRRRVRDLRRPDLLAR